MSRVYAQSILTEYISRNAQFDGLLCPGFPVQNEAILDPSRRRAWNCSRRSGKTEGEVRSFLKTAKERPGHEMIYFALTGTSAMDIMWQPFLDVASSVGVKTRTNKVEKKIYLPQFRSAVKFAGADASVKEMRKVLGKKYLKAVVDEAGSFTIDMIEFIYQKLEPTLIDLEGQLDLIGTCEMIPNTFFQKVCEGTEGGWSVKRWTAADNPFIARQWNAKIAQMIKDNPKVVDAAWFKTHYLNQWVTDSSLILVKIGEHNLIDQAPQTKNDVHILGIDLGWNDSCAFTVVRYSTGSPEFTIVESWKKSEMDFTDVANATKDFMRKYDIIKLKIDGANKQGVEEMKRRHGVPYEEAEKSDKMNYLRMMSDDFICGRGKIVKDKNEDLLTEWSHLIRDPKNPKVEDPRCQNHISDSALYAWRECFHYGYQAAEKAPDVEDEGFEDYLEELELQKQLEERDWWDR